MSKGYSIGVDFGTESARAVLLDLESGEPITTEVLRYGFRVAVLGAPAHEKLKTEQALKVVGPAAFGYDHAFIPLEETRVLDSR